MSHFGPFFTLLTLNTYLKTKNQRNTWRNDFAEVQVHQKLSQNADCGVEVGRDYEPFWTIFFAFTPSKN